MSEITTVPRQLPREAVPDVGGALSLALESGPDDATGAQTDTQAVSVWIRARGMRSAHTFESYRLEATRILVWTQEHGLSLKTLKVDHVHAFYAHLENPPADWLRPRRVSKGTRLAPTQLLIGPLSKRAIAYTRTVLSGMGAYLQDAGYLQRNVFRLSASPAIVEVTSHADKTLTLTAWRWLWRWVCSIPAETAAERTRAQRARWLFALLYHTGIRREEAANARMGDFRQTDAGWQLRVVGKGRKERWIPVNSMLLAELSRYRAARGLPALPSAGDPAPVLTSLYAKAAKQALTPRAVGLLIHELIQAATDDCTDEAVRAAIRHLSTHWLRHTNATHRLAAGASLETTQDALGHADPRTTRIYAKTIDKKRAQDAELLSKFQGS